MYAHPFSDGNGRIHRYLIHHVLAARGFAPEGFAFPVSVAILERFDSFSTAVQEIADMPGRLVHLLFSFLQQNGGRLSQRARDREVSALTEKEAAQVEAAYARLFGPASGSDR